MTDLPPPEPIFGKPPKPVVPEPPGPPPTVITMPWDEAHLVRFRKVLTGMGMSPNTIESYVSDMRHFFKWATSPKWDESKVTAWVDDLRQTYSTATVLRRIASIRCYHEVMLHKQVLNRYSTPHAAPGYAHPLPRGMDDVRDMIRLAKKESHRHLVVLCAFAGMRVSEARFVQRRHIIEDDNHQWWLHIIGKGRKERDVPLVDEAVALLNLAYEPDQRMVPLQDRQSRQIIKDLGERAGIPRPVSSHDLRMTFGTTVYSNTLDLRVVQDLLGHATPETTARYTGRDNKAKIEAVTGAL